MKRKHRSTVVILVLAIAVIVIPPFFLFGTKNQRQLDRALFDAILRNDEPGVVRALNAGANASALYSPVPDNQPAWFPIWELFHGPVPPGPDAPTPVVLLLHPGYRARRPVPQPGILRALIAHGADVNILDRYGNRLLYYVLQDHEDAYAHVLIEHDADVSAHAGQMQGTLLATAIGQGQPLLTIQRMLEHGADPNQRDGMGYSPLGKAIRWGGDPERIRYLLEHHADPNQPICVPPETTAFPPYTQEDRLLPLAYADRNARLPEMDAIARFLRAHGAK